MNISIGDQMRKFILALTLVLLFISLNSQTGSKNIFDKPSTFWHIYPANNSSLELSMGGTTGSANIWDSSPLGVASNPAKLALHEGISSGFFYSYDSNNAKQTALYTTVTWHGIGIMVPMPSHKKRFGEVNLIFESTGDSFFGPELNEALVTSQTDFALAADLLQLFNKNSLRSSYQPHVALGAKFYETYLDFFGFNASEKAFDLGLLLSARPLNKDMNPELGLNFDVSFAYTMINPAEKELQFKIDDDADGQINEDPFDLIDNDGDGLVDEDKEELPFFMEAGERMGLALKLSLPIEKFRSIKSQSSFKLAENLASVMLMFDQYSSSYRNQSNQATGLEISLLDLMSYRCSLKDSAYGFGLNIDLTRKWNLQANMAVRSDIEANSYDVSYRYKF